MRIFFLIFFISMKAFANWTAFAPGTYTFKLGVDSPQLKFDLQPNTGYSFSTLNYAPNISSRAYYGLGYDIFAFTIGSYGPVSPQDTATKGTTEFQDYQFRLNGKYFTHSYFYQQYKGYYLTNSNALLGYNYYQRPDIQTIHYGASLIYNFSKANYSVGAFTDSSFLQTSSGGGLLGILSADHHNISATSSLIPSGVTGNFGQLANLSSASIDSLRIGFGGGYTLVWQGFYLGALLGFGWGPQWQSNQYFDQTTSTRNPNASGTNLKLGIGYNTQNFFAGIKSESDSNLIQYDTGAINLQTQLTGVYFGFRAGGPHLGPLDAIEKWIAK